MNESKIKITKAKETSEGRGATVQRSFPTPDLSFVDPFVLMDHFFVEPPAGFPSHPHRGFEVITYMLEGSFEHEDSTGAKEVIKKNGVQRVTTGKGIEHSEMPGSEGINSGIQLWINLPSKLKLIEPDYATYLPDQFPLDKRNGTTVKTIVGEGSPINLKTQIEYYDIKLNKASYDITFEGDYNGFIYIISGNGKATFNSQEQDLEKYQVILKDDDSLEQIEISSEDEIRFILLKGKPHNEPIKLRGPFVD
ncbi:MAG: Pirin-like protein [Promethearchaeota archaeon]|nr:MAG: Pirin-like protein [Candidatus Lokiarchaeota archaeon]